MLERGKGMKSFKEKIELFWKFFLEEETYLRQCLQNKDSFQKARNRIEELIESTFYTRSFQIRFNSETNKWELMLTPEGNKAKLFALSYWKERAPEELLEYWSFYEMQKLMVTEAECTLEVCGIKIEIKDMSIYPSFEEDRINLEVYIDQIEDTDDSEVYMAFIILMQQFIGEVYDMSYIGEVELINRPKDEERITLPQLKAYIEEAINNYELPLYEDLCEVYTIYELTPNPEHNRALREDVYKGKSALMSLIKEYYTGQLGTLDEGSQLGITYGFIFFNTEKMSPESALNLQNRLEDQLIKINKEKHVVKYIGNATGLFRSYIDCIVFDMVEFISYLEELLDKYDFEEIGFKVFKQGGKKIFF